MTGKITDLTNRDVCLYSLFLEARGQSQLSPTEDIAIRAFQMYPQRFGLVRHPEYPDVDSVRVTLTDLRKPKYGSLVEGDKRKGWRLTESGKAWIQEHKTEVEGLIGKKHPREERYGSGKLVTRKSISAQYKHRIVSSEAFKKWKAGQELTIYDFFDVMRVDPYTPEEIYRKYLGNCLQAIEGEQELTKFVIHLDEKFGKTYRVVS